jgi:hypothetical protein
MIEVRAMLFQAVKTVIIERYNQAHNEQIPDIPTHLLTILFIREREITLLYEFR